MFLTAQKQHHRHSILDYDDLSDPVSFWIKAMGDNTLLTAQSIGDCINK